MVGKYGKHFAPSYYLLPDNLGKFKKEIVVTRTKPSSNTKLLDFHVFPKNFAWSMAFTHEDGWIGPKFGLFKPKLLTNINQEFPAWLDVTVLTNELRLSRGSNGTLFALIKRHDLNTSELTSSLSL